MKKLIFLALFAFTTQLKAQISMSPSGQIGMGTNEHDFNFKCKIKGNLVLTSYPDNSAAQSENPIIIDEPADGEVANDGSGPIKQNDPYVYTGPVEMVLKVQHNAINLSQRGQIGVSYGPLHFYHGKNGYNKIYHLDNYIASDSTIKEDILPIIRPMEIIRQLRGYSYIIKQNYEGEEGETGEPGEDIEPDDEPETEPKRSYGFLAQNVEEILPDIVEQGIDIKLINYNSIIPFLVEAVKEQQVAIESLQDVTICEIPHEQLAFLQEQIHHQQTVNEQQQIEIERLNTQYHIQQVNNNMQQEQINWLIEQVNMLWARLETLPMGSNPPPGQTSTENEVITSGNNLPVQEGIQFKVAKLFDNVPNPFNLKTEIKYDIPVESKSAKIVITCINGSEIKTFDILQCGSGSVVINGSELKSGVYLYTLVVDGKTVDTKRMVLTN